MEKYTILDEPKPAPYSHFASNPLWIFLATMLAGSWLGWSWYAFNSLAIGSATKSKEITLIIVGIVGSVLLALLGLTLLQKGHLQPSSAKYALTVLIVWKLALSYRLHILQGPSFQLHQYFGGASRNGVVLLILGTLLRGKVLSLVDSALFVYVLG